ncbi:XisH family protein [Leptolyngbya sp. CCNP1308]|uniref:XisH family protein n=1 Tax=Leptolyngbya sp. CCNP1308 TaxID=3110255 RepID=UPI002B20E929|nr:XisH family protein [Leptolyngbya sp. CCNP1308]MEA5451496.1 XisH family protein [Leptolyngbya sp. CCNP1308]
MPAKDLYHDAVKAALIKDGWVILADPYRIQYKDLDLYADLAAEQPIAAERAGQKIVVEIKSFVGRSLITDFHLAVGQYKVYQVLLQETASEYDLYLAIDDMTYHNFFSREGVEFLVRSSQIRFFVVNIDEQEIIQWIN